MIQCSHGHWLGVLLSISSSICSDSISRRNFFASFLAEAILQVQNCLNLYFYATLYQQSWIDWSFSQYLNFTTATFFSASASWSTDNADLFPSTLAESRWRSYERSGFGGQAKRSTLQSLKRLEPMEHILTEDGEPMLNPGASLELFPILSFAYNLTDEL